MKYLALSLSVLACLILSAFAPIPVGSQYIRCGIGNLTLSYPDTAPAGQTVHVDSRLTVSCDINSYYLIRVELEDESSKQVLSTSTYSYFAAVPSVTTTLTNDATAPQVTGNWPLLINVAVVTQPYDQLAATTSELFSMTIVPYTPTSASTTQQAVETTTAIIPPSTTTSTINEEITSLQSSSLTSLSEIALTQRGISSDAQIVAILLVIILATILYVVLRRRKRSR